MNLMWDENTIFLNTQFMSQSLAVCLHAFRIITAKLIYIKFTIVALAHPTLTSGRKSHDIRGYIILSLLVFKIIQVFYVLDIILIDIFNDILTFISQFLLEARHILITMN